MRYRELSKRLRELGCQELRAGKGSHRVWYNPTTDKTSVVPMWGYKDLPLGTGHHSPMGA